MIQFEHVYKTYEGPTHALCNIELLIKKGEFVFLTGPSGAGKSTIFRMISAYDLPTSGIVTICEQNTSKLTGDRLAFFRRKIGVVFQDFKLLKDRSIFENVALPLQIMGERPQVIQKKVFDLLDRVSLIYKKNDLPRQLSGGEQQRVAIARALIHQPGVLIADEPTGNLDPELSEEIMDIFEEVNAQGTTVFIATHDHGLVKSRNKRVLKIKDGMLLKDEVLNERYLERL